MSLGAVLEKELDTVSKSFERTFSLLGDKVRPSKRDEFYRKGRSARAALKQNERIVTELQEDNPTGSLIKDAPPLRESVESLIIPLQEELDAEEERTVRTLRNKSESFDRKLELLRTNSQENRVKILNFLSQKGSAAALDLLFKIKSKSHFKTTEVREAVRRAEKGIIKREFKDLLAFFEFSPEQLSEVIEATIDKCSKVTSPQLKRAFNAERPLQVTKALRQIKAALEDFFEQPRIEEWFNTPLKAFDRMTPREALLKGLTFPILYLTKRFDEGIHY